MLIMVSADEYDASWNLDGLNQSIDVIFNISNDLANSSTMA